MNTESNLGFNSIYRGIVVNNFDPQARGRCKVFVYGVYPEKFRNQSSNLPWAEPVMPLYGGNWTNERGGDLNTEVGVSTIPHQSNTPGEGSQIWLFFENGSQNHPKYFAACQSGSGWLSEHRNQHVIKTDNVRIRVDENPTKTLPPLSGEETSTCTFPSYNENCTSDGSEVVSLPTRIDIEVYGNVTINVLGNVNMNITGDFYEQHTGNKHETLLGNLYRHHVGNTHLEQEGDVWIQHEGDVLHEHTGDRTYLQTGDQTEEQTGDQSYTQTGDREMTQEGDRTLEQRGDRESDQEGDDTQTQDGKRQYTETAGGVPLYDELIEDGDRTVYMIGTEEKLILTDHTKLVLGKLGETALISADRTSIIITDTAAIIDHK